MSNFNIRIKNPEGTERFQFSEGESKNTCVKWLQEYGPAPIGWEYVLVNTARPSRKRPLYVLVSGFRDDPLASWILVDQRKAKVYMNNGQWYTVKRAKKHMRAMGATWFTTEKIFDEKDGPSNL